jgi:hypothetical protein
MMELRLAIGVFLAIGSLAFSKPVPLPSAEPDEIIEYLVTRAEYSPLLEGNESQAMRDLSQSVRDDPERYIEAFRSRFIEAMDTHGEVTPEDAAIVMHHISILELFPRDAAEDLALMGFEIAQSKASQARALHNQSAPMSAQRGVLARLEGSYQRGQHEILQWATRRESNVLIDLVLDRVVDRARRGDINIILDLPYLESRAKSAPQVIPRLTLLSIELDGVADREVANAKRRVDRALERAKQWKAELSPFRALSVLCGESPGRRCSHPSVQQPVLHRLRHMVRLHALRALDVPDGARYSPHLVVRPR